ncbi:MAG TPA: FkbM family methyltransferase [Stellaceae bacterium]|nr:FkbM family methyltransferase [Stellaceae bacterium]
MERICRSEEFARNIGKFSSRYGEREALRFATDVSQYGETGLLIREIVNRSARHRLIVDVGVLGRDGSNSYDLLRWFGWKGLLIDANPRLAATIREEFAGLDFELVGSAVSDYTGKARFYVGVNDGVSSLQRQAAAGWGPIREEVEVPVRRLGDILDEHSVPPDFDVLSLDIEGEDIKVMNDLIDNSPYRPRWVIIEASYDFKTKSLADLPFAPSVREAYEMFGQTKANLLLVRREG